VNALVRSYGGNSYYITGPEDLAEVIERDFDYFARPALADIEITVHSLGSRPSEAAVRTFKMRSMGPDEHHSMLVSLVVPGLRAVDGDIVGSSPEREDERAAALYAASGYLPPAGGPRGGTATIELPVPSGFAADLPADQPVLLVTYRYVDARDGSLHRGSRVATVTYDADFDRVAEATDYGVVRSQAVVQTYTLLSSVSQMIRYRSFDAAIVMLDAQVQTLTRLLRHVDDDMIREDIALLEIYKRRLLDLKRDPDRASVILDELNRRGR